MGSPCVGLCFHRLCYHHVTIGATTAKTLSRKHSTFAKNRKTQIHRHCPRNLLFSTTIGKSDNNKIILERSILIEHSIPTMPYALFGHKCSPSHITSERCSRMHYGRGDTEGYIPKSGAYKIIIHDTSPEQTTANQPPPTFKPH